MANFQLFFPKIFPWETGVPIEKAALVKMVKEHADPGGWTKFGITLATWQSVGHDKDGDGDIDEDDLALIDVNDYENVCKGAFWDRWLADSITSQSVAEIVVDWIWASGRYGITEVQKLLNVQVDGRVGPKTIEALNSKEPNELHHNIYMARMQYIERIVLHDIQQYRKKVNPDAQLQELKEETLLKWKNGWINRIESLYKTFQS